MTAPLTEADRDQIAARVNALLADDDGEGDDLAQICQQAITEHKAAKAAS